MCFHYDTLRESGIAVSTAMLTMKALSLSIRRLTRKGQKLSNHLKEIRDDFVRSLQDRFSVFGTVADVPWSRVVNMDETPVYFEPDVHTTIAPKGAKTVSARVCSNHNPRVSVCLAVTATGEMLPPFVVFKGVPGARTKAWLDDPTTEAWRDSVWAPFASGGLPSILLMDDYKCHKQPAFTKSLAKLGTEVEILPGGYTCVLQPLDVDINKPFKDRIRHAYMMWAAANMVGNEVVPSPSREIVLQWIEKSWAEVTPEVICNAWRKCGYGFVV
ncbi:hypothetical protein H257_14640 [Aphanomyces astaci]|uniref:DDE-1 domain-containing protein n=1 Tax=Aphanomyces astaci TaxID=112090 RepID=W4FQP8_APHAT|nr:hypothetical protein H257_14640 [Aphanomyces astaci]ETV69820.1 hypothetical protein H257_14640 [Aphanomyces astaci]|eukprot:XP_009840834.1 hypothetical protein H257_14640 [Aphanomyces astaci]